MLLNLKIQLPYGSLSVFMGVLKDTRGTKWVQHGRCEFKTAQIAITLTIWDALRNLVLFVQFKKREKHRWMSVTFSQGAG